MLPNVKVRSSLALFATVGNSSRAEMLHPQNAAALLLADKGEVCAICGDCRKLSVCDHTVGDGIAARVQSHDLRLVGTLVPPQPLSHKR